MQTTCRSEPVHAPTANDRHNLVGVGGNNGKFSYDHSDCI